MNLRLGKPPDAKRLAEIHLSCEHDLHNSFMCKLGPYFLKTYYSIILEHSGSIVLCLLDDDGRVVGFTCSALDAKRQFDELARYRWRMAIAAIPAVIRQPSIVFGLRDRSNSIRPKSETGSCGFITAEGCRCEFFGIVPEFRAGANIVGLIQATLKIVGELGPDKLWIEVDDANQRMLRVVQVIGAKRVNEITTLDGKRRHIMYYSLRRS